MKRVYLLTALLLVSVSANADIGLGAGVGTLGGNLTGYWEWTQYVAFGVQVNHFAHDGSNSYKGVDYDYHLKLSSDILYARISPFAGGFHFIGGYARNENAFSLTGVPTSGTYTFNGNTYPASQVGAVNASITFKRPATYLGLGWGGNGDFGLTFDLGVLNHGIPQFNLAVSGTSSNPTLAADVAKQQATTQQDVSSHRWWPQVALGFYLTF